MAAALLLLAEPRLATAAAELTGNAKQRFQAGVAEFARGNLIGALAEFEESYRLNPVPAVLFNIAVTQKGLGRASDAIATFQRYRAATAANPSAAPRRAEAERLMNEIDAGIAHVTLSVPPEALVRVDDREVAPPHERILLDPGIHVFAVSAPGRRPEHASLALHAGEHRELTLGDQPLSQSPAPLPERTTEPPVQRPPVRPAPIVAASSAPPFLRSARGAAALSLGALGLASFAVAGPTGGLSLSTRKEYDRSCNSGACNQPLFDRGHTYALVADVFVGVGAAAALVATIVALARPRHHRTPGGSR